MSVFRVERTRDYTVMSNHHLRNKKLSLKAKGLLSQMLSLPDSWDYTLIGLSAINREKIDAIREAVKELEKAGYIVRGRARDDKGRLRGTEYVIYEQPPGVASPVSENPVLDYPTQGKPIQEKPTLGNPTQLNIDITNIQGSNTDVLNTHSIPSPPDEAKRKEATQKDFEIYRDIIRENIDYDLFVQDNPYERDRIDEIVELIVDVLCIGKKYIRVAGNDYPAEVVKARLLKLNSEHIKFVFDCLKENTTKIRNIRQYLLTTLWNAPTTIGNYYSALVNHDLYAPARE